MNATFVWRIPNHKGHVLNFEKEMKKRGVRVLGHNIAGYDAQPATKVTGRSIFPS